LACGRVLRSSLATGRPLRVGPCVPARHPGYRSGGCAGRDYAGLGLLEPPRSAQWAERRDRGRASAAGPSMNCAASWTPSCRSTAPGFPGAASHTISPVGNGLRDFAVWQKETSSTSSMACCVAWSAGPKATTPRRVPGRSGSVEHQDLRPTCLRQAKVSTSARKTQTSSTISASIPSVSSSPPERPRQAFRHRRRHPCPVSSPRTPRHQGPRRHRLRTKAIGNGARLGIDAEVIQHDLGVEGFKVLPPDAGL
jgi:hypothetical protein